MTLSHAVAGVPRTARTRHGRAGVAEREGAAIADVIPLERRSVTPVELPDASRAPTSPALANTAPIETLTDRR